MIIIITYIGSIGQKKICYETTNLYHWQVGRKTLTCKENLHL